MMSAFHPEFRESKLALSLIWLKQGSKLPWLKVKLTVSTSRSYVPYSLVLNKRPPPAY